MNTLDFSSKLHDGTLTAIGYYCFKCRLCLSAGQWCDPCAATRAPHVIAIPADAPAVVIITCAKCGEGIPYPWNAPDLDALKLIGGLCDACRALPITKEALCA